MLNTKDFHRYFWALAAIVTLFLLPFLGEIDFNTKGEPREAIVAYTMLDTNNYILPQNNGEEFAYKPPMFHWLMAASAKCVGTLNEFVARFPSALAGIVLILSTFVFFARRQNNSLAFVTSLILLSSFEVVRAATSCRVDMLLTTFMVLAIYALFQQAEKGKTYLSFSAMLWMGLATLTKGPVGIIVPCLINIVVWWTTFDHPKKLIKLFGQHFIMALGALVLPLIWYILAYQQGGKMFLDLVYEENVLRFIGKMPYHSHENGLFYYPLTLLAGLLPYTLLLLPLAFIGIKRLLSIGKLQGAYWKTKWQQTSPFDRLVCIGTIIIFVFYSIPKSKRSVYILPLYPFIAYYIAKMILYLQQAKAKWIAYYNYFLSAILGLIVVLLIGINFMPTSWSHEKIGQTLLALSYQQQHLLNSTIGLLLVITLIVIFYSLNFLQNKVREMFYIVFASYLFLNTTILPPILNGKSDKPYAKEIAALTLPPAPLYSFVDSERNMLHFFTLNFYLQNQIKVFDGHASKGWLLIGDKDVATFKQLYPHIILVLKKDFLHKSCDTKQDIQLYHFETKKL